MPSHSSLLRIARHRDVSAPVFPAEDGGSATKPLSTKKDRDEKLDEPADSGVALDLFSMVGTLLCEPMPGRAPVYGDGGYPSEQYLGVHLKSFKIELSAFLASRSNMFRNRPLDLCFHD
ncbi:hypothetical protein FOZ60_016747, partial [Perkinsus olseni]